MRLGAGTTTTSEEVSVDLGAFDLNSLAALRALLEEANLTHAGARVGLTQPAMSQVLGRYRRHFDDELLVRVGRDHELTPLARELLPDVQEAVRRLLATRRAGGEFVPEDSDRLFTVTCSDYAMTVVHEPLRRRVRQLAPDVRLEFVDLNEDAAASPRALLRHDVLIGPLGYGFPGDHHFLFHDRLVCVVDRSNRWLADGGLTVEALRQMPHAVASFPGHNLTPVDRALDQHDVVPRVALRVLGFLAVPFAVAGTDAVGIVPERLARLFLADGRLQVVDPPFGLVDMLESAWWHPSRGADPGHLWFLDRLAEVAGELAADDPVAAARGRGALSSD